MPPTAATAGHMNGQGAMDLGIVLQMLKKGILFIPLVIMAGILMIPKFLSYPDEEKVNGNHNISLTIRDGQNVHDISTQRLLEVTTNNASNANLNNTFRDYFFTLSSETSTIFPT